MDEKALQREVLLGFWKAHILHHAATKPVVGQWMMRELHRHGYEVGPGTLYPLLARLEERGWLSSYQDPMRGRRARREYTLTAEGRKVLAVIARQVRELHDELVGHSEPEGDHR